MVESKAEGEDLGFVVAEGERSRREGGLRSAGYWIGPRGFRRQGYPCPRKWRDAHAACGERAHSHLETAYPANRHGTRAHPSLTM